MRDLRHQAVYLFGASVRSATPASPWSCPAVSAAAMQAMLDELAHAVSPGADAVVLMDRAGWYIARDLDLPGQPDAGLRFAPG